MMRSLPLLLLACLTLALMSAGEADALDNAIGIHQVDTVWDFGYTGEGISIAVLDTGIDPNHMSLNDFDDDPGTNDPKIIAFYDALDDSGDDEDDDENELGEDSGEVAAWLMVASFSYVVLRQKISRTKLKELGLTTKQYGQSLQATLKLHMWVSAIATILAVYHAWLMIADEGWFEDDSLTGYIPLVAMIYLTLSGILLWRRLPDDWVDRALRKRARQVHVQRWITVLFVLGLLIHVAS